MTKNIFSKNFEILKFWIFIYFFNEKFFDQKIENVWSKKFSTKKFSDFFRRKKNRSNFFGSPIPIPNFPKIPKIILRTPCDDSKQVENQKTFCKNKKTLFFPLNLKYPSLQSPASDILCTVVHHHIYILRRTMKSDHLNHDFLNFILTVSASLWLLPGLFGTSETHEMT